MAQNTSSNYPHALPPVKPVQASVSSSMILPPISSFPAVQPVQGLPPVQPIQGLPPVQPVQGLPPIQPIQGLPPVQILSAVPPVQGLPPVQILPVVPPVQGLPPIQAPSPRGPTLPPVPAIQAPFVQGPSLPPVQSVQQGYPVQTPVPPPIQGPVFTLVNASLPPQNYTQASATLSEPLSLGYQPAPLAPSLSLQSLAPPPRLVKTASQWLRQLINTVPQDQQQLLANITDADVELISQMTYKDHRPILTPEDPEIVLEIIGFLRIATVAQILGAYRGVADREAVLWVNDLHAQGYLALSREIFILQVEESGVKGIFECRRCHSKNVVVTTRQIRSGDEPANIYIRCVDCDERWQQ
jgi:hypothetical protein